MIQVLHCDSGPFTYFCRFKNARFLNEVLHWRQQSFPPVKLQSLSSESLKTSDVEMSNVSDVKPGNLSHDEARISRNFNCVSVVALFVFGLDLMSLLQRDIYITLLVWC